MDNNSHQSNAAKPEMASAVAGQGVQNSRRRFIRGSTLALPAVMTLHSHTAQAFASITCGEKAQAQGLTAPNLVPVSQDDGMFRQLVTLFDELVFNPDTNTNVPNGVPTFFLDSLSNVWRDVLGANLGATQPPTANVAGGGVGERLAIVHISAIDGHSISIGAAAPPTADAVITSAAGLCMASLIARSTG